MTSIGASIIVADAQLAMQLISPHFIKIHELQLSASKIISELTGAESGFITASCRCRYNIIYSRFNDWEKSRIN